MRQEDYYKYNKFNNGGKKCDLCDYVGEHYCKERPLKRCIECNEIVGQDESVTNCHGHCRIEI